MVAFEIHASVAGSFLSWIFKSFGLINAALCVKFDKAILCLTKNSLITRLSRVI